MPDDFKNGDEPGNFEDPPSFFPYSDEDRARNIVDPKDLVQVQVQGVFSLDSDGRQKPFFVILTDGHRRLPIVIGPFEAQAIYLPIRGSTPDRPMTHDLCKIIFERLGGDLIKVLIDDLWNETYYAKLIIKVGKDEIEIDARPSDAIALAIRFEAPIYVADGILEASEE